MNKTDIEYLDYTWNPIAMLCDPVSPGCQDCWHRTRAKMLSKNPMIPPDAQRAYAGTDPPLLIKSRLEEPLKRKKPAIIGVQFMGDLFHKNIEYHHVDLIWDVMNRADHHKYLILTKRPEQMAEYINEVCIAVGGYDISRGHIWLGVTAENQKAADERISILLKIPASVRFVSVEPMLERIKLYPNWLNIYSHKGQPCCVEKSGYHQAGGKPKIDWVACGAKTGAGTKPLNLELARDLRDQCQAAGVPFFFKSAGRNVPIPDDLMIREFPK